MTPQQILQEAREEFEKIGKEVFFGNTLSGKCPECGYPNVKVKDSNCTVKDLWCYEPIKSLFTSTLQAFIEAEIERLEERVKYIDDYRSGKNEQDFRNGWSGLESGECCDKCRMEDSHFNGRADALKAIVGCRNPFQLKDVCECHIPFRKVAAKVEKKIFQDQISHYKQLLEGLKLGGLKEER